MGNTSDSDCIPSSSNNSTPGESSASEIRFHAAFPEAERDPSTSLDDNIKAECDSVLARHNRAAGFVFEANAYLELDEDVPPLEETFEDSLKRSNDAPPADE
jgi:hypothetical protein